MHHEEKADLANVIVTDKHRYSNHPDTKCVVIDGAAMVRENKPQKSTTIEHANTTVEKAIDSQDRLRNLLKKMDN